MKLEKVRIAFYLFLILPLIMALPSIPVLAGSRCGEMIIVPVEELDDGYMVDEQKSSSCVPKIIDAWTTNDPFGAPRVRVNEFIFGSDILAFVIEYDHCGGDIPQQYVQAFTCDSAARVLKTCVYEGYHEPDPGNYLLINYYDPVEFQPGTFDWAAKVGDSVFALPKFNPPKFKPTKIKDKEETKTALGNVDILEQHKLTKEKAKKEKKQKSKKKETTGRK